MILLVHMLLGATIGSKVSNIFLAITLAFLSHYFLDFLPHIEYPIENINKNQWRKAIPDFLRVALDFFIGALLIFIFSKLALPAGRQAIVYTCAFFAILPDGLTILEYVFPNRILKFHSYIHRKKIHLLRDKKIPIFWRIFSQATVVVICILFLKF